MRPTEVTATYRPNEVEVFQVSVTAAASYPDSLDEAAATAVRGVEKLITAALKLYGRNVTAETDRP